MSLLTHDEQLTLMTLWSVARSPMMFGGHLPDNDDFTLSLMTNDEVLAVDQKASESKQLLCKWQSGRMGCGIAGIEGEVPCCFQRRRFAGERPDQMVRSWAAGQMFDPGSLGEEGCRVGA